MGVADPAAPVGMFQGALRWRPMLLGAVFKAVGGPMVPLFAMNESKRNYNQAASGRPADDAGATLAQASTTEKGLRAEHGFGGNVEAAKAVGKLIAERLKEKGCESVVFDRGGFVYHGRIKALADSARENGLKF